MSVFGESFKRERTVSSLRMRSDRAVSPSLERRWRGGLMLKRERVRLLDGTRLRAAVPSTDPRWDGHNSPNVTGTDGDKSASHTLKEQHG